MNNLVAMQPVTPSNRTRTFVDPDFNLGIHSDVTMTMSKAFAASTVAKASNYVLNRNLDEVALQASMSANWANKGHEGASPQLQQGKTFTRILPTNGKGKGLKVQLVTYWVYPGSAEEQEDLTHVALINHVDFNRPLVVSDADDIQADVEENGVFNCISPDVFAAV